jgi:hypothetical protein
LNKNEDLKIFQQLKSSGNFFMTRDYNLSTCVRIIDFLKNSLEAFKIFDYFREKKNIFIDLFYLEDQSFLSPKNILHLLETFAIINFIAVLRDLFFEQFEEERKIIFTFPPVFTYSFTRDKIHPK